MIQNDKYFLNWTTEDFEYARDSKSYIFKAGSVTPMTTGEFNHFAKHLTDRELNKADIRTNNQVKRAEYLAKCEAPQQTPMPESVAVYDTQTTNTTTEVPKTEEKPFEELQKEEAPKSWCDSCDAKGPIKHKKDCPKTKK